MAPSAKVKNSTPKAQKSSTTTYVINYSQPAADKLFDGAAYEKYLVDHLKIEGKTGQLGENVKIEREGDTKLSITSNVPLSKRYLKFLTKKFLARSKLRDFLRVVASGKNEYQLKFYNVTFDDDAAPADEEEEA
ncbi:60S ribosomal protein L22 [Microbotryomycetes sp. JL201]|nr:60S ribosomal protein L22 [Microbotryomycetes sp. JL201]